MRERGIDPAAISGSGPGGRIVEADVLAADCGAVTRSPGRTTPSASIGVNPCLSLRATADVTSLIEIQKQADAEVRQSCGTPLCLADFLLRAMALALADCPQATRVWQGQTLVESATADVALEAQGPDRRVALVIRQADRISFLDLVRRRAELAAAAREGKLPRDAGGPAAMSLCDLTGHPVDECTPVLTPPHSSALAAGRVALRPAAFDNRLALRQTLALGLTADSRALSPETAAALLGRIVQLLEHPFLLLCERLRA
jgi:pyruvate dehydrogenase E2 component (dihydrolipoamide acetyltransferase)